MKDCIVLDKISKRYGDKIVLDNISFSVNKGEMVAIIGNSGAGKSTLLHILAGIDRSDSGSYYFNGININDVSDKKMAQMRCEDIGYVMQNFGLISCLTAYENIIVPLQLNKLIGSVKMYDDRIHNVSDELGISHLLNKKTKLLSGGEKQRVAIARAIINNPKVILADEPTGSLDCGQSKKIMKIFDKIRNNNCSIIIVTHNLEIANQCDSVLEIL